MWERRAARRVALVAASGLVACSAGSATSETPDAGQPPTVDAATGPQIAGFDFALKEGDFWEYGWREERTVFASSGSSDTKTAGELRITLGAPTSMGGIVAYPMAFNGAGSYVRNRWKYVALHDNVLYASSDGSTMQQLFNADVGAMPGNGFFEDLGGALFQASHGSISNDFMNDSDVYQMSQSTSSSQCQYFPGIGTICGSSGSDKTVHEYYKAGIGPVGYSYFFSYTSGSGQDYFATTTTKQLGLVLSSLRGDTASYVLADEPNDRLEQAMPLVPPVEVHGDRAWGDASVPGTNVPLRVATEREPNDSAQGAQVLSLPIRIGGDAAVEDAGMTVTMPSEDGGTQVVQDWYTFTTTDAASTADALTIALDFSSGPPADLDVYVVNQGLTTILGAGNADNFSTKRFSESVRMTTLPAGTYELLVVDYPNPAATPGARVGYKLDVGFGSRPNLLPVTEWFSVTLASAQRIVVTVDGGWAVAILSGDGANTLGSAMSGVGGTATASSGILQPGTYAIGLGQTQYTQTTAYTMTVQLSD